jgi:hypothetical protein
LISQPTLANVGIAAAAVLAIAMIAYAGQRWLRYHSEQPTHAD